jgi:hypothetical protein
LKRSVTFDINNAHLDELRNSGYSVQEPIKKDGKGKGSLTPERMTRAGARAAEEKPKEYDEN